MIDADIAIPLLMQNKVPEGFETDDKLDVSLRPSEVSHLLLIFWKVKVFGIKNI